MNRYLGNILRKYTRIVVWGTGNFYTLYKDLLDDRVIYFVDNNEKKWGTLLEKKEIFPPEKLKEEDTDKTLVIVCNHFFDEVSAQLKSYGDFDVIDIVTMKLVQVKEREIAQAERPEAECSIVICGGIHAMWQINGSRKFIDGQTAQFHDAGFHTIEIIPLLYYQAGERESAFLAVSIDGIYQGLCTVAEVAKRYPKIRGMVIHSLYYSHCTMKTLLDAVCVETRILYYIHDYSCICFHRFLHRDQKLCIGTDGEMLCVSCSEDEEKRKHQQFHQTIFEKYKVLLAAPSEDTRARVAQVYPDAEIVVLPHLEFEQKHMKKQVNTRIRIAYVGVAIWHKGWEQFAGFVDRFHQKYEFYCLGECPDDVKIRHVTYVPVGLKGADKLPGMTEALIQYGIDIAYIGSVLPETYSYTYYEAYEAGCFILTSNRSGNVCSQVIANRNGLAFSSENETIAWLESDTVQRDVAEMMQSITNVRNSRKFLKYFDNRL